MKTSVQQIVDAAHALLGTTHRYGENDNQFTRWHGHPGWAWCFAAGTLVDTPSGMVPIEDLSPGDEVLSATGAVRRVEGTGSRVAPDAVRVVAHGLETVASGEHPYLVRRRLPFARRRIAEQPEWVGASDLSRGDLIALPRPRCGYQDVDPALAYVMGRWLGDGWSTHRAGRPGRRYLLCSAHSEREAVEKALDVAGLAYSVSEYPTVTQFSLHASQVAEPLADCGSGAHSKRLPGRVFDWSSEARHALLTGWLDADGCPVSGSDAMQASTVSRELAYGMAKLLRSLGYVPTLRPISYPESEIDGRRIKASAAFHLSFRLEVERPQWEEGADYVWVPVRRVEQVGEREVFNLTVADEHTFVADGAAVHNCNILQDYLFWTVCHANGEKSPLEGIDYAQGPAYTGDTMHAGQVGTNGLGWNTGVPRVGQLAIFDWDWAGLTDHIGLVVSVPNAGDPNGFYSIEGNTGSPEDVYKVFRRNDRGYVRGFVTVPYGSGATPKPTPGPVKPGIPAPAWPGVTLALTSPLMGTPGNSHPWLEVRLWQSRMKDRGWDISVDGIYGPASAQACRDFQGDKHLAVDGEVGPITWKATWETPVTL